MKTLEEASDQGLKEWPVLQMKDAAARLLFLEAKLRNVGFFYGKSTAQMTLWWKTLYSNNRSHMAFFSMLFQQ